MKIAFFSDCFLDLTGGITSSIKAQKAALEKNGHTVYVFSSGYPKSKSELKKLAEQNIFQVPSCWLCFRGAAPVSHRPAIVERWLVREHPEIMNGLLVNGISLIEEQKSNFESGDGYIDLIIKSVRSIGIIVILGDKTRGSGNGIY